MITIVSCHHFPDDERVYHRELLSLKKLNQPIQYFTRSNSELDLSDELVCHKNFIAHNFSIKEYLKTLKSHLKKSPPTILHFHEFDLLPLARFVKLNFGSKVVYDVHEDIRFLGTTFSTRHPLFRDFLISMRTQWEKFYLKWVDQIILINPIVGECIFKDWNYKPIILQGYPAQSSVCQIPNEGNRGHSILYHGHLGPERGIKELVEAIEICRNKIPNISLTLLGTFRTVNFQNEIESLIEKLDLSKNINWVTQVPHKEVWTYLTNASVGVIPFLENPLTLNNTPTKLFEFMAAGCGIVASDLPPIRYHVDESIQWSTPESAQSIANGILTLLQDSDLLKNQSIQNSELISNQYNWEAIEKVLLDLYEMLA